jgi:hypothetical protein
MLESGALLLLPGESLPLGTTEARESARTVCDALTGEPVGFAVWRKQRGGWLARWLLRPVLAVHEMDDAPLLFTIHQLWGLAPTWEVRDAEGFVLGVLAGPVLKDHFGRTLALCLRAQDGTEVRDAEGRTLLTLTEASGGKKLTFAPEAEANPFLKMLLVATALVGPASG